jgi:hypothetical protein
MTETSVDSGRKRPTVIARCQRFERRRYHHGIHLIFDARLSGDAATTPPEMVERDGTTDAVRWIPVADIETGRIEVLGVVRFVTEPWARLAPLPCADVRPPQ